MGLTIKTDTQKNEMNCSESMEAEDCKTDGNREACHHGHVGDTGASMVFESEENYSRLWKEFGQIVRNLEVTGFQDHDTVQRDCVLTGLTLLNQINQQGHLPRLQVETSVKHDHADQVMEVMFQWLCSRNDHVSFASCKAMKKIMLQEDPRFSWSQKLTSIIQEPPNSTALIGCLNLLQHIISCKDFIEKGFALEYWRWLIPIWPRVVRAQLVDKHLEVATLYSLLQLWKQLVKFAVCSPNHENIPGRHRHLAADAVDTLLQLTEVLIDRIHTFPRACFPKAIAILIKTAPPFGDHYKCDIRKEITLYFLRKTNFICRLIPQTRLHIGFGGLSHNSSHDHAGSKKELHSACGCFVTPQSVTKGPSFEKLHVDMCSLRQVVVLILKVEANLAQEQTADFANMKACLLSVQKYCLEALSSSQESTEKSSHWLFRLFCEQDDKLIVCLLYLQQIWMKQRESNHASQRDPELLNDPHHLFYQLLLLVEKDHTVLLDFMTSPETDFLPYLTLYLHCISNDWKYFCFVCSYISQDCGIHVNGSKNNINRLRITRGPMEVEDELSEKSFKVKSAENFIQDSVVQTDVRLVHYSDSESSDSADSSIPVPPKNDLNDTSHSLNPKAGCKTVVHNSELKQKGDTSAVLDDIMTMLIQLRMSVERLNNKGLFPYNAKPLLRLLLYCEQLYEES